MQSASCRVRILNSLQLSESLTMNSLKWVNGWTRDTIYLTTDTFPNVVVKNEMFLTYALVDIYSVKYISANTYQR